MSESKFKATKNLKTIKVTGNRDSRGPDNTISIWLDESDQLHIRVDKPTVRCYNFKEVIETPAWIEVIQE